jgi:ribosomal protein S18 acetylase RimI-like enzyme
MDDEMNPAPENGDLTLDQRGQADPGQESVGDQLQIRPMTEDDMASVCEVIGLAFADNPSTLANVRGDRTKACRTMMDAVRFAKFGRSSSYGLIAMKQGQVVGALNGAQWPQCQMRTTEKIKTAPSMVRIMGTALPRAFKMMGARAKHDPRRPHWHIGPIGVRPEFQGHGVGKALLEVFLGMVDDRGVPAFLETDVDRNVELYEKFGFEVTESELIVGVHTRFMWREGQSTEVRSG